MSLRTRSAEAAQRLRALLASWPEPDSLRVFRARELLAILQGVPARIAASAPGDAGDALSLEIGRQVAVAEGFLRDHLPPHLGLARPSAPAEAVMVAAPAESPSPSVTEGASRATRPATA